MLNETDGFDKPEDIIKASAAATLMNLTMTW
jgi:hypothetical protein